MKKDSHHIQLRLSAREIGTIAKMAERYHMRSADVIRGALGCGLPVFKSLTEARQDIMKKFVGMLKKEARRRRSF